MSKPKPFQDHFHPRGEWVLCKLVHRKSSILRVNEETLPTDTIAQVVEHGPGEYQNGVFVAVEGLAVGTIVRVPGDHCRQFPDWKAEGLFICPASSIVCIVDPMDDLELAPKILVPQRVPVC